MQSKIGYAFAATYVAVVVLANVLSSRFGLVPIGFGLVASAGTYAAGAALVCRDLVQRQLGKLPSLGVIVVGSALSYALASPAIATASLLAFAISELIDFGVYTPLRARGFLIAAAVSTLIAGAVDTVVFLHYAGFPVTVSGITGQIVGKGYALLIVLAFTALRQVRTRQVVTA